MIYYGPLIHWHRASRAIVRSDGASQSVHIIIDSLQ